jgi:hypothetical protein
VTLILIILAIWFAVSICAGLFLGALIREMGR